MLQRKDAHRIFGGVLVAVLIVFSGCQPDRPDQETRAPPNPQIPPETSKVRSAEDRMATRFMPPSADLFRAPEVVEIPLPDFPGRDAIWGATGRDDRGHIWLGVAAGGVPQPSAHLLEYIPQLNEVYDRGSVVDQLQNVRPLKPGESQMKIHSKIVPADDGYLYFASMDEAGEKSDGSSYPTWGGHLWRMKPFASEWEHLLATKEALIAVAGNGRWIYALGYFDHMLYQFDTQTETTRNVRVGSIGGHISRNFLVDLAGHAYVPRVKRQGAEGSLTAELIEWDEQLNELQAVPLPDYKPTANFDSHGIVGWTWLADGDLLFTTSQGGLWRIHPADPVAEISYLGAFHPEGRSYPSALYTFAGKRYVCGMARNARKQYEWVVYDLETRSSRAMPLPGDPFQGKSKLLLYGSHTRDNAGNGYLAGRSSNGPVLFKLIFPQ